MEELIEFLKAEFPEGNVEITASQHHRAEPRKNVFVPHTDAQFRAIIEKAPLNVLYDLGFAKWSDMNSLIVENNKKSPISQVHEIDILNSNEKLTFVTGKEAGVSQELLEENEDVLLIPGEWYNVIPEGFMVTGLWGETEPFVRANSDDDIRFGCLAYGIRRKQVPL